MKPPYLFDCNSFNVLSNYYPDQFPSFWEKFEQSITAGQILSCKEVLNELGRLGHNEWIRTWAQAHKELFEPPTAEEGAFVAEIFKVPHFHQLVGKQPLLFGHPVADPFIIASAAARGGCVVTEEQLKPHAAKIPNVCDHFKVHCTNVEGFLKQNGWKF
jgi:Domain of unknown function (DUF4411)